MNDPPTSNAPYYEIRLKGHLEARWVQWFEGLAITLEENGTTLLSGSLVDQAALHGILKKVRDLGLTLLSVNYVEPDTKVKFPDFRTVKTSHSDGFKKRRKT
jgi:hypothetical protein